MQEIVLTRQNQSEYPVPDWSGKDEAMYAKACREEREKLLATHDNIVESVAKLLPDDDINKRSLLMHLYERRHDII